MRHPKSEIKKTGEHRGANILDRGDGVVKMEKYYNPRASSALEVGGVQVGCGDVVGKAKRERAKIDAEKTESRVKLAEKLRGAGEGGCHAPGGDGERKEAGKKEDVKRRHSSANAGNAGNAGIGVEGEGWVGKEQKKAGKKEEANRRHSAAPVGITP